MTVIGYIRVSTKGQAKDGISLEAQEAKIRAWCVANESTLEGLYIETMSGGRADNRPKLQKAIQQVCQSKGALIVYSLSRLARSTKDAILISERLDKAGADLVSLSEKIDTTSAAGKMIFRMLAVLAEFERDQISERTTAAMEHLRRQNRRISSKVPFGYDLSPDKRTLTRNPAEEEAIYLIQKLRGAGKSFRKIARHLESRNVKTKKGGQWRARTIKGILDRQEKILA